MKTLKILIITLLLCFVSNAQTLNPTKSDYECSSVITPERKYINEWIEEPIKINGVRWSDFPSGVRSSSDIPSYEAKLKRLFGNDMKEYQGELCLSVFNTSISSSGGYYQSKKKGLYIEDYGEGFVITNKNSNITIMGVTLTIGDSINKLKNVKIDYENNVIFFENGTDVGLFIKFDPKTKKITRIYYTTWI